MLLKNRDTLHVHMPVYNAELHVEEAIEAVLEDMSQSGVVDFELMLADDASTDGSKAVLQQYERHPNVTVTRNFENLGVGGNHSRMLDESLTGGVAPFAIAFRDNDDISIPGSAKLLLDELERPGVGLVSGAIIEFNEDAGTERLRYRFNDRDQILRDLSRGHIPAWNQASIFRSSAIIDNDIVYPTRDYCDDLLFQALLVTSGVEIVNLDVPTVYYRKHQASVTTGHKPSNARHYLEACREIWGMAEEYSPTLADRVYVLARTAAYLSLSSEGKLYNALRQSYRATGRIRGESTP